MLPNISAVLKKEVTVNMVDDAISTQCTHLDIGISKVEMQVIQEKDDFCKHICNMLDKNLLQWDNHFH